MCTPFGSSKTPFQNSDMAALYQRYPWRRVCGMFRKKLSRQRRGSGSIFFEDIEKLHEFDRILVFKNETP